MQADSAARNRKERFGDIGGGNLEEISCMQRLVIDPENSNKKLLDLLFSLCHILDVIFSSYKYIHHYLQLLGR